MSPDTLNQHPAGDYAKVEIMGHRSFIGRVTEVEKFGSKMLRIEPIIDGKLTGEHYTNAASLYGLTPISAQQAFAIAPKRIGYADEVSVMLTYQALERDPQAQLELNPNDRPAADDREYNSEHPDHPDYEEDKPIVLEEGEEIVDSELHGQLINVAQAANWLMHRISDARAETPKFDETKRLFGELEKQLVELKRHYKDLQIDTFDVYATAAQKMDLPAAGEIAETADAAANKVAGLTADQMLQTAYGPLAPEDELRATQARIRKLIDDEMKLHDGNATPAVVRGIVQRIMKEFPPNEEMIKVTRGEAANTIGIDIPRGYFFEPDHSHDASELPRPRTEGAL